MNNNCNCNRPKRNPCVPPMPATNCNNSFQPICDPSYNCCAASMSATLQAIKKAVYSVSQNGLAGFGVNILITTKKGENYTIFVSSITANQLIISGCTVTSGNTIIDLNDISKIRIESGATSNPAFITILVNLLKSITTCPNTGCCAPLALTIDDDEYDIQNFGSLSRGYCNQCNRPQNQCICPKVRPNCCVGMQNFINNHSSNLATIDYLGGYNLTTLTNTTVVNNSQLFSAADDAISNIQIPALASTTVVTGISYTPVTLVNSISTTSFTLSNLATEIGTTSTLAISGYNSPETTTVVSGLTSANILGASVLNVDVIQNITNIPVELSVVIIPASLGVPGADSLVPVTLPIGIVVAGVFTPATITPITVASLNTTATTIDILDVTGVPALTPAITSLGIPSTTTVIDAVSITSSTSLSVVTNVDTQTAEIPQILDTTTGTIIDASMLVFSTIPVITSVTLSTTTTQAITGNGNNNIPIYKPVPDNITGSVLAVGSGITVIQELNGDITVYSICRMNGVTAN